jgi:hypothetical protein
MVVPKRRLRNKPEQTPHDLEIGERDPVTGAILVSKRDPNWTTWTFESDITVNQPVDVRYLLGRTEEPDDSDGECFTGDRR